MKKYLSVLFIAVFALVLTGCGANTLTCTHTDDNIKEEVKVFFKGDKATKVEITSTYDAGSNEKAKEIAKYYENDKDSSVKVSGSKVIIKSTEKPEKDDEKLTKKEAKESLEESGYKCK
ncbi:MAG: hypothetical protein IKN87_03060 [Bacilli bacterium]|nr:hypothetical protein [Bacilli bacterium]